MRYVGIDIGKWKCQAAVMDPEGTIIDVFTFLKDAEGVSVQPVHRSKPVYVRKEKAPEYEAGTLTVVQQSSL